MVVVGVELFHPKIHHVCMSPSIYAILFRFCILENKNRTYLIQQTTASTLTRAALKTLSRAKGIRKLSIDTATKKRQYQNLIRPDNFDSCGRIETEIGGGITGRGISWLIDKWRHNT